MHHAKEMPNYYIFRGGLITDQNEDLKSYYFLEIKII
jgi:hypothetical protein